MTFTFHEFLERATQPRIGKFAEYLFFDAVFPKYQSIQKKHKHGVDFQIAEIGPIDVKAVRKLDVPSGSRFSRYPTGKRVQGVTYSYLIFWKNEIELRTERDDVAIPELTFPISQIDAQKLFDKYDWSPARMIHKMHDRQGMEKMKSSLATWIKTEWNFTARVIYRGDRMWNDDMAQRRWGADNFYQSEHKGVDLVVQLLVDGENVYEVQAYPVSAKDEISWKPKPVGANPTGIMGYDPQVLNKKFIFCSLDEFKSTFRKRFSI